ncbi:MAG: hypothetical protein KAI35_06605 [Desulfobulbaceae bacterium]|nr:hypothetical protein [Desulfobulbaceae bacterium]
MKIRLFVTICLLLIFSPPCLAAEGEAAFADGEPATETVAAPIEKKSEQDRDPFSHMAAEAIKPDYDKAAGFCRLRGIVKAGGRARGLFAIDEKADNSAEALHPLTKGDIVRIMVDSREYLFTISRIGNRSVVIIGENNKPYDVRL